MSRVGENSEYEIKLPPTTITQARREAITPANMLHFNDLFRVSEQSPEH